jgi:hypothetical protein
VQELSSVLECGEQGEEAFAGQTLLQNYCSDNCIGDAPGTAGIAKGLIDEIECILCNIEHLTCMHVPVWWLQLQGQ